MGRGITLTPYELRKVTELYLASQSREAVEEGEQKERERQNLRRSVASSPYAKHDDMTGHKVYGKRKTSVRAGQPVVIEGIHGLNSKLTEQIPDEEKFKIYISPLTQLNIDMHNRVPTTDERMLRRMVRDYQFRGHSAQDTIAAWPKVRAGEDKNIFPFSDEADVLFNSYHDYEISVLKKYAEPLLKAIKPEEPEYAEAVRMLKFLRFFQTVDDDSAIVNNSIMLGQAIKEHPVRA